MTPYWLFFAVPFIAAFMPLRFDRQARTVMWTAFGIIAALMVGLRHEVGGDWDLYLVTFEDIRDSQLREALGRSDVGYVLLNMLSDALGWGIYGTNLACGILFAVGFTKFARRQPIPWLAWVITAPYLFIVVVMGYSRQGVALGFVFWALSRLEDRQVWRFILLIVMAALFHKAAVLALPFAFMLRGRRSFLNLLGLGLAIGAAGGAFIYAHFEHLWLGYVEEQAISEGAPVRVAMNAVPAGLMLLVWRAWQRRWPDPGHWRYIALASIGCIFLVGLASTAVDRVALFLAPIQVYVWCRFPLLFKDGADRAALALGIAGVYGAVLWVWLNLGIHARLWLPYRNLLLGG